MVLLAFFAFSGGCCGSLGYLLSHDCLGAADQAQAAVALTFAILSGITAGSLVGKALFDV